MVKNNGKEYFINFLASIAINLGLMVLYYYLHAKQSFLPGLDIPRFTTVTVVFTAFFAGLISYFRHKEKSDVHGAVFICTVVGFLGAFIGSVGGAAIAANLFGKMS